MIPDRIAGPLVSFVGAGPGDPELLTLRAMQRLQQADIVLHDALGTGDILALLPSSIRRIDVGKRAGRHAMPQEDIDRLLVRLARPGRRIVRLKGGDPSLFGRLDEELNALRAAGIACEIVPGITAATAAAAAAGISLTSRGKARRVQFVTGHTRDGEPFDPVASGLDASDVTSVIYMARAAAAPIRDGLLRAGWSAASSVLVVAAASQPGELHIRTSLNRLENAVATLPADAPLVLILGTAVTTGKPQRFAVAGAVHATRLQDRELNSQANA
ncbi:MAG: uroporphyrinogen-III C-methyltransferase [Parvibaculaceae bacterium]|nr:uroporphyrinogen-III C-methyltransferase [Parvibaculaceae bacterium]